MDCAGTEIPNTPVQKRLNINWSDKVAKHRRQGSEQADTQPMPVDEHSQDLNDTNAETTVKFAIHSPIITMDTSEVRIVPTFHLPDQDMEQQEDMQMPQSSGGLDDDQELTTGGLTFLPIRPVLFNASENHSIT